MKKELVLSSLLLSFAAVSYAQQDDFSKKIAEFRQAQKQAMQDIKKAKDMDSHTLYMQADDSALEALGKLEELETTFGKDKVSRALRKSVDAFEKELIAAGSRASEGMLKTMKIDTGD